MPCPRISCCGHALVGRLGRRRGLQGGGGCKFNGGECPPKPTTAAQPAYERMAAAGKPWARQGVNITGPENRTKSTNELKGEGGKFLVSFSLLCVFGRVTYVCLDPLEV